ncbi:MAG TPA: hypothetical protein VFJ52_01785 [Terriglobia bacterium]|nr:hypothetical protein [Terriglobia bacterium]
MGTRSCGGYKDPANRTMRGKRINGYGERIAVLGRPPRVAVRQPRRKKRKR